MVSILGDYNYVFPKPIPLKLKLKDMLEDNVDESYYLSDKMLNYCMSTNQTGKWDRSKIFLNNLEQDVASTITTKAGNRATDNFVKENVPKLLGGIGEKNSNNGTQWYQQNRIYDSENVSICLSTIESFQPNYAIKVKNATKQGYLEATEGDGINISSRMEYQRGNVQKDKIQTLTTQCDRGVVIGTYQFSKSDKFMQGKDRFQEGKETSDTLQTNPKEAIVLKKELCNELIINGKVEEGDVVKHSYTQQILDGNKKCVEKNDGNMITLTTRGDCVGVCVKENKVINPLKGKSGKSWQFEQQVYDENGSTRTLKASEGSGNIPKVLNNLRIRKLTPKECFRLMGVKDEDYENCAKNQSNASLYHLAGDSIVVNVLMAIFSQLFERED